MAQFRKLEDNEDLKANFRRGEISLKLKINGGLNDWIVLRAIRKRDSVMIIGINLNDAFTITEDGWSTQEISIKPQVFRFEEIELEFN